MRTAVDLETTGLNPERDYLIAAAMARPGGVWVADLDTPDQLARLCSNVEGHDVVYHNAAFETAWFSSLGVSPSSMRDTMLMAARLFPGRPKGLDALASVHCPEVSGYKAETQTLLAQGATWQDLPRRLLHRRNAADAWVTLALHDKFWPMLSSKEQAEHNADIAIARVVDKAARKGLHMDLGFGRKMQEEAEQRMTVIQQDLGFLPSSSQQTATILEGLGVALPESEKGNAQTGEVVLRVVLSGKPNKAVRDVIEGVLEYRGLAKVAGTYVKGYALRCSGDGYLRSSMRWPGTISWRPSSSNPNILNIPRGKVRTMFDAPPGHVLFEADYSQAELRIAAALSQDPVLCGAYREGRDVHTQTAARVFGIDPAEVTKDLRHRGKTLNFGTIYGAGATVLWQQFLKAGIVSPLREIGRQRKTWWAQHHVLEEYIQACSQAARYGEPLHCAMGSYKWSVKDLLAAHPGDYEMAVRATFNATIQAIPPRMTGLAMVELDRVPEIDLRLHTYDGIVGYLPIEGARELALTIKRVMEEQAVGEWWRGVPCPADVKIGPNWGHMEEVT